MFKYIVFCLKKYYELSFENLVNPNLTQKSQNPNPKRLKPTRPVTNKIGGNVVSRVKSAYQIRCIIVSACNHLSVYILVKRYIDTLIHTH